MDFPRGLPRGSRITIIYGRDLSCVKIGRSVMALSTSFDHSHSTLSGLLRTVRENSNNNNTTLPERPDPANESSWHTDGAMNVSRLEGDVADIKREVNQLGRRTGRLEIQVEDVKTQVTALQINSLRRMLDDPIEPISAPVEVENGRRYMVASDFPETIKDFWKLVHDSSALSRLVRHYSIRGWQKWGRSNSDDTEASLYDDLDDAVAAHPHKCLRILASKWGLQYSYLERPNTSTLGKRRANTQTNLDPKRHRVGEGVDEEDIVSQGRDGNIFMHNRDVWPGPRVPANPYRTMGRIQPTVSSRVSVSRERRDWLEGLGLPLWRNDDVFGGHSGMGYLGLELDWSN